MPFHVEIRRGHRWAREFNLDEATLRESVLEPWVMGRPVLLGDREWEPEECELRVLEGPELSPPIWPSAAVGERRSSLAGMWRET